MHRTSFGFSVGDAVSLTQLAWTTVQNTRKACGEHDEIARQASSLHILLQRLEHEVENPSSLFNKSIDNTKEEILALTSGCEKVLKTLDRVLAKYNALSDTERKGRKLWLRIRFGNGEIVDMRDIRAKMTYYTSALSLFLNTMSIGSAGRVEQQMNNAGEELREIKSAVNTITAQMMAANHESTVLTSYVDDDKAVWKELRRELVADGFKSAVIHKYKNIIKAYVSELAERGLLDEQDDEVKKQNEEIKRIAHGLTHFTIDRCESAGTQINSPTSNPTSSSVYHGLTVEDNRLGKIPTEAMAHSSSPVDSQMLPYKDTTGPNFSVGPHEVGMFEISASGFTGSSPFTDARRDSELYKQPTRSETIGRPRDELTPPDIHSVRGSLDEIRGSEPGFQRLSGSMEGSVNGSPRATRLSLSCESRTESNVGGEISEPMHDYDPATFSNRNCDNRAISDPGPRYQCRLSSRSVRTTSTQMAVKDPDDGEMENTISEGNKASKAVTLDIRTRGLGKTTLESIAVSVSPYTFAAIDGDFRALDPENNHQLYFVRLATDNVRLVIKVLTRLLSRRVSENSIRKKIRSFRNQISVLWRSNTPFQLPQQRLKFSCAMIFSILRRMSYTPWPKTLRFKSLVGRTSICLPAFTKRRGLVQSALLYCRSLRGRSHNLLRHRQRKIENSSSDRDIYP